MLDDVLSRGFDALVLTNAMKPMRRLRPQLLALRETLWRRGCASACRSTTTRRRCTRRSAGGEAGRRRSMAWSGWRATGSPSTSPAGASPVSRKPELRAGFARLFAELDVPIDAADPVRLMLFPEMDAQRDVPEITTACWGILHKSPDDVMCASARMVVKRKDAATPDGAGLHAAGIRSAVRTGPHAGGGGAAGVTQPSLLRVVLRARRRGLQPLTAQACPAAPDSSSGSIFSLASARRHFVSWSPSNTMVSSAGTDSQAFCWISASSWPGPQPA